MCKFKEAKKFMKRLYIFLMYSIENFKTYRYTFCLLLLMPSFKYERTALSSNKIKPHALKLKLLLIAEFRILSIIDSLYLPAVGIINYQYTRIKSTATFLLLYPVAPDRYLTVFTV